MKKIKLYVLITVVSIVLLAWLLVVVIVFQKNHADIFFFDNNKEIEYQYGNYKADALVVDGYVYLNPGKEGGLSLSKRLQNKLRTIAEKVYFNYLKVFFIDTLEAKKMADKLHNSDADESHTQDPEFEAIGDGEILADENVEANGNSAPTAAQADAADDSASGNDNE